MKVLIICLSNISNVASAVPIVDSLDRNNADHQFTMLSRPSAAPLFSYMKRVVFKGLNPQLEYCGISGALKLLSELKKERYDAVVDLQASPYTNIITTGLSLTGIKSINADTQKTALKHLIIRGARSYRAVKNIFNRYSEAFGELGLVTDDKFVSIPIDHSLLSNIYAKYGEKTGRWIGIAPLSAAKGKTLPPEKMQEIIRYFYVLPSVRIFLFGITKENYPLLEEWEKEFPNLCVVIPEHLAAEELALMSVLNIMLSMDSGNMHLAALTNTPVISIWGQTHPYAGFLGWKQPYEHCVGVSLACRPCTVHSSRKCRNNTYLCLTETPPNRVIIRMLEIMDRVEKERSHAHNYMI